MDTSFQYAILVALATLCMFVAGNYMVNRVEGMCPHTNLHETQLWGTGFAIYAALDYLILTH